MGSKVIPWNLHIWDPNGLYKWNRALYRFSRIHRVRAWRRMLRYIRLPRGRMSLTGSKVRTLCERSVRAVRFPETQVSIVSIALRDQLIHNILVWRAVQRESLTRQGSKAGKIRVRTGRESDRLRWEPEEKLVTARRLPGWASPEFEWREAT